MQLNDDEENPADKKRRRMRYAPASYVPLPMTSSRIIIASVPFRENVLPTPLHHGDHANTPACTAPQLA